MPEKDLGVPAATLAALSQYLLEGRSMDEVLGHICTVAVKTVPGAEEASVTLVGDGAKCTYGATSELPAVADERQYEVGSGPCLDAARANQWTMVADFRTDERWPAVTKPLAREGLLSSMSIPLPVQGDVVGALNSYARRPSAFDESTLPMAEEFASLAAVAVANGLAYDNAARAAAGMREAMRSRAAIEQAKGIIIGRTGCDAERAFQLLVQQSQHENRKLREVAEAVVSQAARRPT